MFRVRRVGEAQGREAMPASADSPGARVPLADGNYGNEESVGEALRRSGVPRDEVFITTKFDPTRQDPVAEAERSLERLGVAVPDPLAGAWRHLGLAWDGARPPARPPLPRDDVADLDGLDRTGGTGEARERKWW